MIAMKNIIDARIQARRDAAKTKPVKGAKRVRVTGTIS
jgi:electron transport complex protein RnfE